MNTKITIIHGFNIEPSVVTASSAYAPKDMIYIVPGNDDFLKIAKTCYQFEKERNEWIRKYDRVLQGLKYWRARALEK